MAKINVLSFAVANLIAAGEVVDRPASVIKELMENAIDAGASHITVEIQHGGVTFMRVADDGCGIDPEDLPVAIRRHATSKIREADDLDGILTLGFRGEALAAIAAVSDLRIITRTKDAEYGSMLVSSAGEVKEIVEQGAPVGTTVIVENLFANVPARRKFLKKDVAETTAVTTYVEKIALSRPEIAIRLIVDGNLRLDTAGDGTLESVMYAVFGRDFVKRMIPVKSIESDAIAVDGYICRPDNARPDRFQEKPQPFPYPDKWQYQAPSPHQDLLQGQKECFLQDCYVHSFCIFQCSQPGLRAKFYLPLCKVFPPFRLP